jgi:hypothetical protein
VLHHAVLRLGIDVFALSDLGVTTDKNSALYGTFSAATKTVQVSVRSCISNFFSPSEEMTCDALERLTVVLGSRRPYRIL